jgi:hypothetical protein
MIAEPMFVEGGIRVLDAKDEKKTVGFVFVEPTGGATGGQLQRWILNGVCSGYCFAPWTKGEGAPESLAEWTNLMTTPAPGEAWGEVIAKGLWVPNALYVVAQSKQVMLALNTPLPLPLPIFPRHQAVLSHTSRVGAAQKPVMRDRVSPPPPVRHGRGAPLHRGPLDRSPGPNPKSQIIIGEYLLNQLTSQLGYGFGDLVPSEHVGQKFFESSEYFLFMPGYRGAGHPTVPLTSIEFNKQQTAIGFHDFVLGKYTAGARYEVIGCNYYQSKDVPPGSEPAGQEMTWFL